MEKLIKLNSNEEAIIIYGKLDENLRYAEREYKVKISARNHRLKILGAKKNVDEAYSFFKNLLSESRSGGPAAKRAQIKERISSNANPDVKEGNLEKGSIHYYHQGKMITGRNKNQKKYLESIRDQDIVFGIGPAGTGKTYLAMAAAIEYLKKKFVSRIILTRPAVEAGENLGFLPGDLAAKVNPYLRPLYDALYDMMDMDEAARGIEREIIEVAPLAYMRGRTLNDAFVILDEAQNTTPAQMKMFLTRLGPTSKAVITGDITQIDLPDPKNSGLVESRRILSHVHGIKFVTFEHTDVVRHRLVQEIIKAYEKNEKKS